MATIDSVKTAKFVALPATFMLAGYYTCSSQNPLPIITDHRAAVSTPIFARVYARGTVAVVPATVLATSAFGWLAYATKDHISRRRYATSAALAFAVLPWTAMFMMTGIKRLIEISQDGAKQAKADATLEVRQLLKRWTAQNYVRAALTFAAGVLGLATAL